MTPVSAPAPVRQRPSASRHSTLVPEPKPAGSTDRTTAASSGSAIASSNGNGSGSASALGSIAVLVSALSWSTVGLANAALPHTSDARVTAALRLIGGGVLLAIITAGTRMLGKSRRIGLGRDHSRGRSRGTSRGRSTHAATLATCAVAMAVYQAMYFTAIGAAGVAVGVIVSIGTIPVFVGLFTVLRWRRRPGTRWLAATVLAVIGSATLVLATAATGTTSTRGILCAATAGCAYAVFTLASSSAIQSGADAQLTMTVTLLGAGTLLSPTLLLGQLDWLASGRSMVAVGYIMVIPTAVAYALCGRGMRTVPATTASTLFLAEPAGAAVIGLLVLHEPATRQTYLGLAMVVAAMLLLSFSSRRPKRRAGAASQVTTVSAASNR